MMQIEKIVDRAVVLTGFLSHGAACLQACIEAGAPELAGIVSTMATNRALKAPTLSNEEVAKQAALKAAIPRHLAAIAAELEEKSRKRGGNWGHKALAAIRRGQPRAQQLAEAYRRAIGEIEGR